MRQKKEYRPFCDCENEQVYQRDEEGVIRCCSCGKPRKHVKRITLVIRPEYQYKIQKIIDDPDRFPTSTAGVIRAALLVYFAMSERSKTGYKIVLEDQDKKHGVSMELILP